MADVAYKCVVGSQLKEIITMVEDGEIDLAGVDGQGKTPVHVAAGHRHCHEVKPPHCHCCKYPFGMLCNTIQSYPLNGGRTVS